MVLDNIGMVSLYCNTIFFSHCFLYKKINKIRIPRHGLHLKKYLYRTLSSIKQKFQKGAWPKCFIQDIVQYKAKVYSTPFINAVKLPLQYAIRFFSFAYLWIVNSRFPLQFSLTLIFAVPVVVW